MCTIFSLSAFSFFLFLFLSFILWLLLIYSDETKCCTILKCCVLHDCILPRDGSGQVYRAKSKQQATMWPSHRSHGPRCSPASVWRPRSLPLKNKTKDTVSCETFSSAVTCDGVDDALGCLTREASGRPRPRLDSAALAWHQPLISDDRRETEHDKNQPLLPPICSSSSSSTSSSQTSNPVFVLWVFQ